MKWILTKVMKSRETECGKNFGTIEIFQREELKRKSIKEIRDK